MNRWLCPMLRMIKIVLLSAAIILVLLVVISRFLPPGMPAHQH